MALTRRRKFVFATVAVAAVLGLVEGAARIGERLLDRAPDTRAGGPADFRVAFYGGSTVAGVPLPEVGFVEQFRVLFEARYPDVSLEIENHGQAAMPSAGVAARVAATVDARVDFAVVLTGHNEFIRPEMTEVELRRAFALGGWLDRLAAARLARRLAERLSRRDLPLFQLDSTTSTDLRVERRLAAYVANVEAIVDLAEVRRVPLVLGTLPANVADWPPARPGGALRHPAGLESPLQQVRHALDGGDPVGALRLTDALARGHPGDATVRYLRGRALHALGRRDEAQAELNFARDHDPLPRRVLSSMNEAVRRLAATHETVGWIDLEREFDSRLESGGPTRDWIADNCHPSPRGGYLIAVAVLAAIETSRPRKLRERAAADLLSVDAVLSRVGFDDPALRLEYLTRNARYCMKTPFFNYAAARRYLDEALELAPERWDLWANHASMSLLSGERQRGIDELERALLNVPASTAAADVNLTPYLNVALQNANLRIEHQRVVSAGR